MSKIKYDGYELDYFDNAYNFRNYSKILWNFLVLRSDLLPHTFANDTIVLFNFNKKI